MGKISLIAIALGASLFFNVACNHSSAPAPTGQTAGANDGSSATPPMQPPNAGADEPRAPGDAHTPPGAAAPAGREAPAAGASLFRLMIYEDPATTVVLGYNASSTTIAEQRVHFDTVDHGRDAAAYKSSAAPAVIQYYLGMNNAFVRLSGLQPETSYYFVVTDTKGVSARYWFKTAPASPDRRLSIIAGGDSRDNRVPRQNANILVSKLKPTAVMFGGDMTDSCNASEWKEWLTDWQLTIGASGRLIPIIPTRGNHETSNDVLVKIFDAPASVYYAVTLGTSLLRIYTLNTNIAVSGAQASWLQSDLAQNSGAQWKFAQYHKPMRPHNKSEPEGSAHYDAWSELFHKYGMDVASESDSHLVKTTYPIKPATGGGSSEGYIRDDVGGTVYIGEGGWGAPLRAADDAKPWTRATDRLNHFHWLFVGRDKVELRVILTDNAAAVASLPDSDPFQIPAALQVWAPPAGAVVTLDAAARH